MFADQFTEASKIVQLVVLPFPGELAATECGAEGDRPGGGGSGGADCSVSPGGPTGETE